MLRAGMCAISIGIAVVAVAVVVKSVGTYAPRPAHDASQAERFGVSVVQKLNLNRPAYWTTVSLRIPDNGDARGAGLQSETVGSGTHAEKLDLFDERYSFQDSSASFGERFVGGASLVRRATAVVVKTESVLPQYAALGVEPRGYGRDEAIKSASLTTGPVAAAPSSVAPPTASANSGVRARVRRASLSSLPDSQSRTAIYDISAQVVYLPNGRRLEAHSGLGSYMDDPRYVHIRRKGATPPNTYRLVPRESLFHGVQAIRLIPVAGSNMFGRDGILAHHYLLGPNGQSNGCVSFADYPAFLSAYQNGEIDRLIVVERLENPPPGQMIAAGWVEKAFKGMMKTFERGPVTPGT